MTMVCSCSQSSLDFWSAGERQESGIMNAVLPVELKYAKGYVIALRHRT